MSDTPPELAVILAAGEGRRLEPTLAGRPKALARILHRTLLARQLELLVREGVREVLLVVRRGTAALWESLPAATPAGLRLHCLEQAEPRGIAHALACAAPRIDRPFVLLLGDVYLESEGFGDLFAALDSDAAGVLGIRRSATEDERRRNYGVTIDPRGEVLAVREKPGADFEGELGVGLYLLRPRVLRVLDRTPRSSLRGEVELTDALGLVLAEGARFTTAEVSTYDRNLNDAADLLAANLHALRAAGGGGGVHPRARIDPGARVEGCVVEAGASVAAGAELVGSLVLAGEHVPPGRYRDAVFASGAMTAVAPPGR